MSYDELRVVPKTVAAALVLRLSGALADPTVRITGDKLTDATVVPPPPRLVVLDLREVTTLAAAGVRVLAEFVHTMSDRGVRVAAVLGRNQVVTRAMRVGLAEHEFRLYESVDSAIATEDTGTSPEDALADQMAALTRVLLEARTVEQALRQVVSGAVVVIPHAQVVSLTLRDQAGRFFTPIETDSAATELDQVQYTTGRGPCVDVAVPDSPGYLIAQDLTATTPWPQFAAAAVQHGFGSVLATALQPFEGSGGALNIYSYRNGFTEVDRHRALLLATHASLALAHCKAVQRAELQAVQMRRAIESRDVIGQAKGILMARQGLSAEQAFALLCRTSQDLNIKLAEIAGTVVGRHTELGPPEG